MPQSRAIACRAGRRPTLATRHFMDAAPALTFQNSVSLPIALPAGPAGDGPAAFSRAPGLGPVDNQREAMRVAARFQHAA